ncbi:MAG: DUF3785 family protein [Clostridiaceae bacterium]|nr:DUF3785 family protein [Clostridiaceae bacterium]
MKFTVKEKEYELDKEKLSAFFNDEEAPIKDINEDDILNIIENIKPDFDVAYYSSPCEECKNGGEKRKAYKFFEYHFYIYTKDREYVTNSIQVEQDNTSFKRLSSIGKVDDSYIVSIIVCSDCGDFTIEIEEFEI